ncbi:glycine cleavage system H protein [Aureobasidium pullulans]|nr:glycine cleavage system H protein [Aureobasidium pullulans]
MRQWREQISILSYLVSFGAPSRFPHQRLPRVAWRTTSSLSGELYVVALFQLNTCYFEKSLTMASIARSVFRRSLAVSSKPAFSCRIPNAAVSRPFSARSAALAKKYTQDHEWIELSPDNKTGTIGISTYAANALGDVVFVELPTTDLEVSANDTIGSVESVKSASDIMTPVAGVIVEANAVLEEKPGTINKSPEGDGWIAKIEVKDVKEVEGLMDAEAYKAFTEESEE